MEFSHHLGVRLLLIHQIFPDSFDSWPSEQRGHDWWPRLASASNCFKGRVLRYEEPAGLKGCHWHSDLA